MTGLSGTASKSIVLRDEFVPEQIRALGIARGALELIEDELSGRVSVGAVKMSDIPTVQVRIAEAGAEIDCAEAVLLKDCDDAMRIAASGEQPSLALRARWRRNNAFALRTPRH